MVETFCGFRLHTAAVFIGWIGAAISLFNIAIYIIMFAKIDEFVKDWIVDSSTSPSNDNIEPESAKYMVLIVLSIYLILNVINCTASCLLIAGAMKEKHLMIVPWLVNSGLALGCNLINVIGVLVYLIINGATFGSVLITVIFSSIVLGLQFYTWSAMHSLFKLIRESAEQQRLILPHKSRHAYPSYTKI